MRVITHVAVLLSALLLLSSCDFAQGQWAELRDSYREATTAPREIERGAKPEIIVNRNIITFDGKSLHLGADIQEWIDVLGSNYRAHYGSLVWDDKGLAVTPNPQDPKKVRTFEIALSFKKIYSENEPHYEESLPGKGRAPAKFFDGYLELNGIAIDSKSTVDETNRRSKGKMLIRCSKGINVCNDSVKENYKDALMYFEVDSRKQDSIIYYIQITHYPEK